MSVTTRSRWAAAAAAAGCFAALASSAPAVGAGLLDWPDLAGRPLPAPTEKIAYGPGPDQFGELWLPEGKGPLPVVLMVHGGCWLKAIAGLGIMNYAADDLRRRGIAVWNIEYRGVDQAGGGYPGTFADVTAGADALTTIAAAHHLRLDRVVALGHSAGGHLGLWLAARDRLPAASALKTAHPLRIAGVVSLGGLPDLEPEAAQGVCGAGTIARLVGRADLRAAERLGRHVARRARDRARAAGADQRRRGWHRAAGLRPRLRRADEESAASHHRPSRHRPRRTDRAGVRGVGPNR